MSKQLEIDKCSECKHFGAVDVDDYDFTDACFYYAKIAPLEEDISEHIINIEDPETIFERCPLPPYQTNIVCDMSRDIPDYYAEIEILEFLRKGRDSGKKEFDIIDLIFSTNLPPEQINRILEKLMKRNDGDIKQ